MADSKSKDNAKKQRPRFALLSKNKKFADNQIKEKDGWNTINQITAFVESLDLPSVDTDSSGIYSIITSVPTPWARAYMMNNALRLTYVPLHQKDKQQGMDSLYSAMQDEYKGLLTTMALYSNNIKIQKVKLEYSEQIPEDQRKNAYSVVDNIFEVSGAFGNMLFEDRPFWADPKLPLKEYGSPYFQLIIFDHTIIGATSPFSLVYPAAHYDLSDKNIPYFKNGRFLNPITELSPKQLEKVFHYANYIKAKIEDYAGEFKSKKVETILTLEFFREWIQEIREYISANFPDYVLRERGILDYCDKFHTPFDKIFNVDTKIYRTKSGKYLLDKTEDCEEFNPDVLLLSSDKSVLVKLDKENGFNPNLSTILHASVVGDKTGEQKEYFTLPLSPRGLSEFYNCLDELLNVEIPGKSLVGEYNPERKSITVTLELEISGILTPFSKTYPVYQSDEGLNSNVVLWPNFISPKWNRYFLYSEILHNDEKLKAFPIIADPGNLNDLLYDGNSDSKLFYITENKRKQPTGVEAGLKVFFDKEKVKQRNLRYEIYESTVPFKGIELRVDSGSADDFLAGYILIDTSKYDESNGIIDHTHDRSDLVPVNVGIDFGSTNTCISYQNTRSGEYKLMSINNRRRFILGKEINKNFGEFAKAHELFFFQNDNQFGIIRSAMLLNNELRLEDPMIERANAITGGFPLFESNLDISDGDSSLLNIRVQGETEKLLYDLKWKREDKYLMSKKAFVKMLWLYVNAELYDGNMRPVLLNWAYPSSMPKDLRRTYEFVYREALSSEVPIQDTFTKVANVEGEKMENSVAITESEAVCNFALSRGGVSLNDNTIFVGFDIGGVTSDILLLVNDPSNSRARLAKQSSVKVAADRISKAVSKSPDIQRVLKHFCHKFKQGIGAIENINSDTASFLLNILFDKMESEPKLEQQLYSQFWAPEIEEINRSQTRGVMAVAAYITGMLMFHSGQMVRSYIQDEVDNKKNPNKRKYNIRTSYFGKGGKLFQWIPKAISEAVGSKYFEDCFKAGLGKDFCDNYMGSFILETKEEYLKLEVAYGLSAPRSIIVDDISDSEIIGEEGYCFDGKPLKWNEKVKPEYIFEFGERLSLPTVVDEELIYNANGEYTAYPNFNSFLDLFFNLIKDWDLFDYTLLQGQRIKFATKSLENYVKSDEDWLASSALLKRSQIPSDFKYSCSPFLYQGACFLDEVFIKKIFFARDVQ
jgi:hypothetical protein